jgi:hypothetical protein
MKRGKLNAALSRAFSALREQTTARSADAPSSTLLGIAVDALATDAVVDREHAHRVEPANDVTPRDILKQAHA